jgi:hypothetical protein
LSTSRTSPTYNVKSASRMYGSIQGVTPFDYNSGMLSITDEQAAYIAALIDGEGSVECQRELPRGAANYRYVLRVSFTMGTKEPLHTVGQWLGLAPKMYPPTDPSRQPRWRLHLPKSVSCAVLERVMPYLILKRRQAELVLAIERVRAEASPSRQHFGTAKLLRMPDAAVRQMEELHQQLRSLKSAKRPAAARFV